MRSPCVTILQSVGEVTLTLVDLPISVWSCLRISLLWICKIWVYIYIYIYIYICVCVCVCNFNCCSHGTSLGYMYTDIWIYVIYKYIYNKLTPWSRVPEKLTVPQLGKKFPSIYLVYTSQALVPILSQINPVHPHSTSSRSIWILSSHLRLGLSSGFFLSYFPSYIAHPYLLCPYMLYDRAVFFFVRLGEHYLVRSRGHTTPHYIHRSSRNCIY